MELDVDIIRRKLSIVSLFMITMYVWLLPFSAHTASRGISVISDLSHQSGKLGAFKALIIGINDYNDPKIPDLETSVNDTKVMANLLSERYGFEVKLPLNHKATREVIYRALRSLASTAETDDSVLIYYAGHGDLDRLTHDGWWIPADAKGGDPVTYLNNFLVQTYMRSVKARHVLLIPKVNPLPLTRQDNRCWTASGYAGKAWSIGKKLKKIKGHDQKDHIRRSDRSRSSSP
jgi:hypothetical protein